MTISVFLRHVFILPTIFWHDLQFLGEAILFWKDSGGEFALVSKAIPQLYQTLTFVEQINAQNGNANVCSEIFVLVFTTQRDF